MTPRAPPFPPDEDLRLDALQHYAILDTPPSPEFDDIVALAAALCDTSIATITLVDEDRQWFKARRGLAELQTPRSIAICAYTILQRDALVVEDLRADERFRDNPMVAGPPFLRFYAGFPLINDDGLAIGTLTVMDQRPRQLDGLQKMALEVLAEQVMARIESARTIRRLGETVEQRDCAELELRRAHDRLEERVRQRSMALEQANAEQRELAAHVETARERLAEAQAVAKIGSWEFDLEHRTLAWSAETFRIFQVDPASFRPDYQRFLELVDYCDRDAVDAALRASIDGDAEAAHELEHRRTTPQGDLKLVQHRWKNFYDASGRAVRAIGTVQDITERKAEQERLLRLGRMHEVLSGVNSLIVRATGRKQLFEGCCRIAAEHGRFGAAWIDAYDRVQHTIEPVACDGVDAALVVPGARSVHRAGEDGSSGLAARAIIEGGPVLCHDFTSEPSGIEGRRRAVAHGYQSGIALPLTVNGEVTGTLSLLAREPDFFDEVEVKLLKELAADISLALDRLAQLEQIRYFAHYDVLTGLPNRTLLAERLGAILQRPAPPSLGAVVHLDLQRLHDINDTFGRRCGDDLLKLVGLRLRDVLGDKSPIGRIAADHFVFVLSGLRDSNELALGIEHTLARCFGPPFLIEDHELRVTARAGVAVFPQDGGDAEDLLKKAERALNRAKAESARFLFYTPEMNAQIAATLLLESRLRVALEKEQFVLHYQPKIDSATGAITGVEGLIRWNDPESGLVPPLEIIPLLEESGLILEVGQWVMREAMADYQRWRKLVPNPPRVAINVSAIQLRQDDFVAALRREVAGLSPEDHGLDLEITESVLMSEVEGNIAKLDEVRKLGVRVAIDDFGTGYSSLLYLSKLPLDALKVDRSFIVRMAQQRSDLAIVSTIVSLAHELGLTVVAEGVDAPDQVRLLEQMECDEMQGFLFSEPLPAAAMDRLIQSHVQTRPHQERFSMN